MKKRILKIACGLSLFVGMPMHCFEPRIDDLTDLPIHAQDIIEGWWSIGFGIVTFMICYVAFEGVRTRVDNACAWCGITGNCKPCVKVELEQTLAQIIVSQQFQEHAQRYHKN